MNGGLVDTTGATEANITPQNQFPIANASQDRTSFSDDTLSDEASANLFDLTDDLLNDIETSDSFTVTQGAPPGSKDAIRHNAVASHNSNSANAAQIPPQPILQVARRRKSEEREEEHDSPLTPSFAWQDGNSVAYFARNPNEPQNEAPPSEVSEREGEGLSITVPLSPMTVIAGEHTAAVSETQSDSLLLPMPNGPISHSPVAAGGRLATIMSSAGVNSSCPPTAENPSHADDWFTSPAPHRNATGNANDAEAAEEMVGAERVEHETATNSDNNDDQFPLVSSMNDLSLEHVEDSAAFLASEDSSEDLLFLPPPPAAEAAAATRSISNRGSVESSTTLPLLGAASRSIDSDEARYLLSSTIGAPMLHAALQRRLNREQEANQNNLQQAPTDERPPHTPFGAEDINHRAPAQQTAVPPDTVFEAETSPDRTPAQQTPPHGATEDDRATTDTVFEGDNSTDRTTLQQIAPQGATEADSTTTDTVFEEDVSSEMSPFQQITLQGATEDDSAASTSFTLPSSFWRREPALAHQSAPVLPAKSQGASVEAANIDPVTVVDTFSAVCLIDVRQLHQPAKPVLDEGTQLLGATSVHTKYTGHESSLHHGLGTSKQSSVGVPGDVSLRLELTSRDFGSATESEQRTDGQ